MLFGVEIGNPSLYIQISALLYIKTKPKLEKMLDHAVNCILLDQAMLYKKVFEKSTSIYYFIII